MNQLKIFCIALLLPLQLLAQFQIDTRLLTIAPHDFDIKMVIDLDQDGLLDIVSARGWYPGVADGEFADFTEAWDQSYVFFQIYASDIDLDGDIDLIGKLDQFNEVLLYNNGSQQFTISVLDHQGIEELNDLDGDGAADALYFNADQVWYRKNTSGTFNDSIPIVTNQWDGISYVRLADMDNDTDMDLFVLHADETHFATVFYNANGSFDEHFSFEKDAENPMVDYWQHFSARPVITEGDLPSLLYFGSSDEHGFSVSLRRGIGDGQFADPELIMLNEASGCLYSYLSVNAHTANVLGDAADEILSFTDTNIMIWKYDESGGYQLIETLQHSTDCSLIQTFQLDQDHYDEMLSYDYWSASSSALNFNDSAQMEEKVIYQQFCGYLSDPEVFDFDLDGDGDIIFHCENSGFAWLENLGGYFAEARRLTNVSRSTEGLIVDTDNDGIMEFYLQGYEGIFRYERNDEGNLELVSQISSNGLPGREFSSSDVDGDGDLDFLSFDTFQAQAMINDGNGNFSPMENIFEDIQNYEGPRYQVMKDWDQDGDDDFVFSSEYTLYWKENLGDGEYEAIALIGSIADIRFTLIDLDGDGDLDVMDHLDCSTLQSDCWLSLRLWEDNQLNMHQYFPDAQVDYYGQESLCEYTNTESSETDLLIHGMQLINDGTGNYEIQFFEEVGYKYVNAGPLISSVQDIIAHNSGSIRLLTDEAPNATPEVIRKLAVYPNPAQNILHVEHPGVQSQDLLIYDSVGRLLQHQVSPEQGNQIDLSGFSNGLYFLELKDKGAVYRTSFVVCR